MGNRWSQHRPPASPQNRYQFLYSLTLSRGKSVENRRNRPLCPACGGQIQHTMRPLSFPKIIPMRLFTMYHQYKKRSPMCSGGDLWLSSATCETPPASRGPSPVVYFVDHFFRDHELPLIGRVTRWERRPSSIRRLQFRAESPASCLPGNTISPTATPPAASWASAEERPRHRQGRRQPVTTSRQGREDYQGLGTRRIRRPKSASTALSARARAPAPVFLPTSQNLQTGHEQRPGHDQLLLDRPARHRSPTTVFLHRHRTFVLRPNRFRAATTNAPIIDAFSVRADAALRNFPLHERHDGRRITAKR